LKSLKAERQLKFDIIRRKNESTHTNVHCL
jgi:hypothetical protein